MKEKFTHSFKIQAVEKALNRDRSISLKILADNLGVGYSTLQTWVRQSNSPEFERYKETGLKRPHLMPNEKRPQDWSQEEKLKMVTSCATLSEEETNKLCREKGLYPHHVKQWKDDFLTGNTQNDKVKSQGEMKTLRSENKALKKELRRKDKALAETAALLVLQKKVHEIWGNDEDNSQ